MKLSKVFKKALAFGMAFTVCATSVPVDGLQNVWAKAPVSREDASIVYFVDCGDYVVNTVNTGEQFGTHNSVTDQVYGEDVVTGYKWGIVDVAEELTGKGVTNGTAPAGKGIATANTWANEYAGNANTDCATETTFRYSKNFYEKGYEERYVDYAFELEAGAYEVTVGSNNTWECADSPKVTAKVGNITTVISDTFTIPNKGHAEVTGKVVIAEDGEMTVDVRGTGGDNLCACVSYILIKSVPADETEDQANVRRDKEALTIADTARADMNLPTTGVNGSTITWESNNKAVIANDGKVTRPADGENDAVVTLVATIASGDASDTKEFTVTVPAEGAKKDIISDINLSDVEIEDAYLVNATNKEHEYLLSLNSKQFLYQFYKTAGLTPPTATGYEGWERESGNTFRGHMFGHYMSGLAMSYAYADDKETKADLLVQIKDAVEGLKECQDAYAAKNPKSAGFIAPFGEGRLDNIDGSSFSGRNKNEDSNVYVPWYNLHKVLAGLTDIYTFVDDKELANTALSIAEKFSEYIYNRCSNLSDNTKMLNTEYGGMNEALYEVYDITGNEKVKKAAQYFDEVTLFNSLANNQDVLSGKHANTTIPKLTGALKRYTVMMNNESYYNALSATEKNELEKYKNAAINFWDIVINHHTYITGGNSQSEHFHNADKLYYDAVEVGDYGASTTCETCNTYNMLKLSRELYKLTKDKKYMDYYENTYLNAIVSSQNPETGTTMYFQPMAPGYNKVFNRPYDEFWCCTGTGVENFSKLGDTFYFTEKSDVYVNMYFANTYEYARQNLKLTMDANMPNDDEVTVKVEAIDGTSVKEGTNLKFRIPDWTAGEATLLVNGEKQTITEENGYAVISDVKADDVITLKFPMEVVAYATQDNDNFIAFKYGPVVLSAALGTNNIEASEPNGILVRVGTKDSSCQTVVIVNTDTVEEWKENIAENLVRIEDSEDGKVQFVLKNTDSSDLIYTPHFMRYKERYGLYMTFEVKDSENAQKRIKTKKENLRGTEMTVDSLDSFDGNNSEAAKNVKYSDDSTVGSYSGRTYRDAKKDGWFSYDMKVDTKSDANLLISTYTTADAGRKFDLYINNEFQKTVQITNTAGTGVFYEDVYNIPEKYWADSDTITVKYQSNGGLVGGLYGIAIRNRLEYNNDPELLALTFDKGTLSPKFSADAKAYSLIVPTDTKTVSMKVSPNVPSGLVYVNDILIDDTLDREIALTSDKTVVQLTTYAQDHETKSAYTITVIKADGEVDTTNQDAANVVIGKINDIGTVVFTDECKAKIEAARVAYDALTAEQKALVTNVKVLIEAEKNYELAEPIKLAEFTFDDEEEGFFSEYAIAENSGSPVLSDDAVLGKSLKLNGSSNYLTVTDANGKSLLTDYDEITVSYWSKISNTNANWAFYAAPNTNKQTYQKEKYLGILENASITSERYNNNGSRPASANTSNKQNVWKHVTVVYGKEGTTIYVDGEKKSEQASSYALTDLLGDNSILYLGKANWENGEYFNGLIDEVSIYNYAMDAKQVNVLYWSYDENTRAAADEVIALINKIGTVTLDSKSKIEAARAAYEKLTDVQKALVTNINVLKASETKFKELEEAKVPDKKPVETPEITVPTPELILANNPGIPTGNSEEAKNAEFGVLKAQVKKATKNSNKLQWSKVADADGYVVLGNLRNSGKKKYAFEVLDIIENNATTSYTHKSLKKDTYYKYIVQAYKMIDGKVQILETSKTIYSATKDKKYANVKSLKVKAKVTLKVKKKATLKVTQKKSGKKLVNCRKVSFESSNTKVATVNKKGVITAKKKGSCTIYVYAQNGIYKKVNVKVKK